MPVEIIRAVFAGFPFLPKVTEIDEVKIWNPTTEGIATKVRLEISLPAALCVEALAEKSNAPISRL